MYDSRGIAIPLSFDHKPQQVRERKRIHDAGGFIAFRGVWRVAGVLATSRALGDYPLKDKVWDDVYELIPILILYLYLTHF